MKVRNQLNILQLVRHAIFIYIDKNAYSLFDVL